MTVVHQRKRVLVYFDDLAARGKLAGGPQSSMVIEEVGSSGFILVSHLHDAVGFAGIVPNLDFFSIPAVVNFVLSPALASPACSVVDFCGTPHLVHAIAIIIVFAA